MSRYWQVLLQIDAVIDLTDAEALAGYFGARIFARDGSLNETEMVQATRAMGLAQRLVSVFASTPGYQCPGTRTHADANIVLLGTDEHPDTFSWLFDSVNLRYGTQWQILAAQTYDAAIRDESILDAQGNPTGETQTITTGVVYRPVPQSIRPWLARDLDAEGVEIAADPVLTASRLGSVMGTTPWVIASGE